MAAYDYYHLTKSYRDAKGKKHNRCVLGMGRLEEFTRGEREELADMLTVMIEKGQCVMHENIQLYEKAIELYAKYRESKYARENDPILIPSLIPPNYFQHFFCSFVVQSYCVSTKVCLRNP